MTDTGPSDGVARVRQPGPGLSEYAASYVRDEITSGAIAPGARVRPEDVASELGISSTPAREALQALRSEGFLVLQPRRGFAVAPVDGDDIRDMYLAQAMVAGELAARASQRARQDELDVLTRMHEQLVQAAAANDLVQLEKCNHAFHRQINLIGGGGRLAWMVRTLSRWAPRRFYPSIPGWPQTTVGDHEGILGALIARDAEQARTRMSQHIVRAGDQLALHFDARRSAP
jgi:DNA-binding GntR family transcriptional regulator